ncbi:MAG TPA: hypothetical protein VFF16_11380 [Telluria sp.]|nr:hypothetical protein [Telluria sp.]
MPALLMLFLLYLIAAAPCGAADSLRVCTDVRPHPPLMTATRDGIVDRILVRAAAQAGIELVFYSAPLARCRVDIRNGTADAFPLTPYLPAELPNARYPQRHGAVDPARGVIQLRSLVLRRKGEAVEWNGERFSGLDGPVLVGFTNLLLLDLLKKRAIAFDASGKSLPDNLAKFLAGRGGAVVALEAEVRHALADPALAARVEALAQPFSVETYYLAVADSYYAAHPEVAERLWDAIAHARPK